VCLEEGMIEVAAGVPRKVYRMIPRIPPGEKAPKPAELEIGDVGVMSAQNVT
jgi:hypothetical protein